MKGGYNRSLINKEARKEIEEGMLDWQSEQGILERVRFILNKHTEEVREVGYQLTKIVSGYSWEEAVLNHCLSEIKDFLNE